MLGISVREISSRGLLNCCLKRLANELRLRTYLFRNAKFNLGYRHLLPRV